MSYNNDVMGAALDRHITGNWGEDQYKDSEMCDDCPQADTCEDSPCRCSRREEILMDEADRHNDEVEIQKLIAGDEKS